MNEWNNFNTLDRYSGNVWVTKDIVTRGGGNVCYYNRAKNDFIVIAYLRKNDVNELEKSIVKAIIAHGSKTICL